MKQDEKVLRSRVRWLLIGLTVAVYWRVSSHAFVNYDDLNFVCSNPHVYSGLSFVNLTWALTTLNGGISSYHPLTWLSHQLDCQLFGLNAGPQHLTNLWFHVGNTVLLFTLLDRLTGKLWRSAVVAALFALHPLHVETVAWISERKTLVCVFFWVLATLAYVRYARERSVPNYLLVVVCYVAALLSKPIAVSLPITLVLLDYWPLGRLGIFSSEERASKRTSLGGTPAQLRIARRRVIEKVPLFVLSALTCWVTVIAQTDLGATKSLVDVPMCVRLTNSIVACVLYLRKMVWPADLAPIYPLRHDWSWWQVAGCGLFLLSISVWVVWWARRRAYLLFGWGWFLVTIFPTLGLVQVGSQGMADRYSYVPLIGIFVALVWLFSDWAEACVPALALEPSAGQGVDSERRQPLSETQPTLGSKRSYWRQVLMGATVVAPVMACAGITALTVGYWRDSISLFQHATKVTDGNYIAYSELGLGFLNAGNLPEAERFLRESLRIKPQQWSTEGWLGEAFFRNGNNRGAFEHFRAALKLKPANSYVHGRLAELFSHSKDPAFFNPHRALQEARLACQLTDYRNRELMAQLARICAENRLFKEAADAAHKALVLCVTPSELQDTTQLVHELRQMEVVVAAGVQSAP